jgi:hypothetical protein
MPPRQGGQNSTGDKGAVFTRQAMCPPADGLVSGVPWQVEEEDDGPAIEARIGGEPFTGPSATGST